MLNQVSKDPRVEGHQEPSSYATPSRVLLGHERKDGERLCHSAFFFSSRPLPSNQGVVTWVT